jgi:hypothetical protein
VRSYLKSIYLIFLILLVSVAAHAADGPSSKTSKKRETRRTSNSRLHNRNSSSFTKEAWDTLSDDYMEFYTLNRLKRMGLVFGSGAIVANTNIDEYIQKKYQTNIRSSTTDDVADVVKNFGEYKYLIPVTVAAALMDNVFEDTAYNRTVGRWGKRMMRSYLLGTPLLLTLQPIIGASRPSEGMGSNWHPFSFDDVNGISTHAFIGAVPFLTMAGMSDDNLYLKSFFYLASTACAWSRINDNAHYFSQAGLGWYLAWESTDAILDRENEEKNLAVSPMFLGDGYGISINMQW